MEMMHVQSTHPEIPTIKCTAALSREAFHQANYLPTAGFISLKWSDEKQRGGLWFVLWEEEVEGRT